MVIEYSNLDNFRRSAPLGSIAFAASAIVFIAIPLSLIAIGYYSTQPTGTLISPLPQNILSEEASPTPEKDSLPIIAVDNLSTPSSVETSSKSNSSDYTATILAGTTQVKIEDEKINSNSQILIIPKDGDSTVYFVKSKGEGFAVLGVDSASAENRTVDYQVVAL